MTTIHYRFKVTLPGGTTLTPCGQPVHESEASRESTQVTCPKCIDFLNSARSRINDRKMESCSGFEPLYHALQACASGPLGQQLVKIGTGEGT